jgi:hypothetical protein
MAKGAGVHTGKDLPIALHIHLHAVGKRRPGKKALNSGARIRDAARQARANQKLSETEALGN